MEKPMFDKQILYNRKFKLKMAVRVNNIDIAAVNQNIKSIKQDTIIEEIKIDDMLKKILIIKEKILSLKKKVIANAKYELLNRKQTQKRK